MKRHIILTGVVLTVMASCTQSELKETATEKVIGFRTPAITKGTELTTSNLGEFYATALLSSDDGTFRPYFENARFIDFVDFYTSTPAYYWPADDIELTFAAYAPSLEISAELSDDSKDVILADFAPDSDISKHKDLITAKATGSAADAGTGVEIAFRHRLAQINFNAKNDNPDYIYRIKGYRIGNVLAQGSYSILTDSWTTGQGTATYTGLLENPVELSSNMTSLTNGDNAMVIPQQLTGWDVNDPMDKGSYIAVLINITTKDGAQVYPGGDKGSYDWIGVPLGLNLSASYRYNLNLDFSNSAGYVAPELEDDVNNTPGTLVGNELALGIEISDWEDKIITPTANNEIAGIWRLFSFEQENFRDDGTVEWYIANIEDAETEEERNEIHEMFQVYVSMFVYMKIPAAGNYIIPLNDDGTETDNKIPFTYVNRNLIISGMQTEDGWTIPHVESIEDDPERPGEKIRVLKIDRENTSSKHNQYLRFHFTPEA